MRIYVASSWRNKRQQEVVSALRGEGHEVYDFKNPRMGEDGFHWSDIDPCWQEWTVGEYRRRLLTSREASYGFMSDMRAMQWAEACLLVMPCGRSAHLEMGWMAGAGKITGYLIEEKFEPELMTLMCDDIFVSLDECLATWRGK